MKIQTACLVAVAALFAGCGDDDDTSDRDEEQTVLPDESTVASCSATIASKETQFATQLASAVYTDAPEMIYAGTSPASDNLSGRYRDDLTAHPGCLPRASYDGNAEPFAAAYPNEATVPSGTPVALPGYDCAGKAYAQSNEDTSLPIVILVHGNAAGVTSWEEYYRAASAGQTKTNASNFTLTVDSTTRAQLATRLLQARYRVYAFDARTDRIAVTPNNQPPTNATGATLDHGYATPLLQSFITAVLDAHPGRKIALIGHSLGVTEIRDALRRLYVASASGGENPFTRVSHVIMVHGANHGVVGGTAGCAPGANASMYQYANCELGDRDAYQPTYFMSRLNGPGDIWATPCADGDYAYGNRGACGGNVVEYTTITMRDIEGGRYQDELISQTSARLDSSGCVTNGLVSLNDYDTSNYYLDSLLPNHFGGARSDAGIERALAALRYDGE